MESAAAARLELGGQVDAGDPVLDLEAEELRAARDRGAEAVALLEGVGPSSRLSSAALPTRGVAGSVR